MALANPLRKVAAKLMAKFGGVVTINRVTAGVYNPTTGTASETVAGTVVRGVLEDVNVREVNDLIQSGDKRLTVAAADVAAVPSTADRVLIGGVTHQIIRVTTIEQDNTAITHELDPEGIMARTIRIGDIGDYANNQMEKLLRNAVLETELLLKMASPVDTGRFRASWQVGENAPLAVMTVVSNNQRLANIKTLN
jgi:hypothetical protein